MERSGIASLGDLPGTGEGAGPGARFWAVLAIAAIGVAALAGYEYLVFDWHPAREEAPVFSAYHWSRTGLALIISAALIGALASGTKRASAAPPGRFDIGFAACAMLSALAATGLMVASPAAFAAFAREDYWLEWSSAALLFAASGLFALELAGRWRRASARSGPDLLGLAIAAGFAGLFFVMAMEEISWMQRVLGFATPETMAEANWQGEFNLHNFQTDFAELGLYAGAGVLLVFLPLLRELAPGWRPLGWFDGFVPDRTVAAVSAPMAIFTCGHWNLLPIQMVSFLTVFAMAVFARDAARRDERAEAALFAALGASVAIGQTIFLIAGDRMVEMFDATEWKEFYLALGLAWFAWRANRRVRH